MDAHPRVRAKGEILADAKDQGAQTQLELAQACLSPPLIGRHAAVGFKTKLMDVLDPGGFSALLAQERPMLISLLRRNRVKLVVSWINSERLHEARGRWQSYTDDDRPPVPFTIDVADFRCRLETLERLRRDIKDFVSELELPTFSLFYEDLLAGRRETLGQVFSFLGVKNRSVKPKCIKTTSDDLRDVVANLDELRSHYLGTPYERMFDEVLVTR
jgi:hypothetical protein